MANLLDVKQVADRLGCSWRSIYRLADNGQFPFGLKVGNLRRWTPDQIENFIGQQTQQAAKRGGR